MTSSSSSSSFLRPLARRSCKHPDQQSSIIQFSSESVIINKIIVTNRRKNVPLKTNMDISRSRQRRRASSLISSSSSSTAFPKEQDDIVINSQQLDRWVRDSAIQIVNNLDEAPLLVHINCCNNDPNTITIKMVKDEKDNPPPQPPDAVILVKQVVYNCSSTKLWGILIQGKGKSCTASYLLKTSRVGLCTHFCLSTRLHCFVEHAHIQLQNMWLAH